MIINIGKYFRARAVAQRRLRVTETLKQVQGEITDLQENLRIVEDEAQRMESCPEDAARIDYLKAEIKARKGIASSLTDELLINDLPAA